MTDQYNDVRRVETVIYHAVQSILESFVFNSNDDQTWAAVTAMTSKFLTGIWQDGALQGSTARQAFRVQCGLGSSMTQQDIINGYLKVTTQVAVVHPEEYIVLENQIEMAKP